MTKSKKLLVLIAALLLILAACTSLSGTKDINITPRSTGEIEDELMRLQQVNLTIGSEEFDLTIYPVDFGFDIRNGMNLIAKFICLGTDACPESGKVYLVYQGMGTEEDCLNAKGSPLVSRVPDAYWGCVPVID